MNKEKELVQKANQILKNEGITSNSDYSAAELLEKFILPGLENSKGTLASLYSFEPGSKQGFVGKLKTKILQKFKNIVINVTERQSIKQQKFNEQTYQAIKLLYQELNSRKKS